MTDDHNIIDENTEKQIIKILLDNLGDSDSEIEFLINLIDENEAEN